MLRFFKPIINTGRVIAHEAGIVCTGATVGYVANTAVNFFINSALKPYMHHYSESDREQTVAPCTSPVIKNSVIAK